MLAIYIPETRRVVVPAAVSASVRRALTPPGMIGGLIKGPRLGALESSSRSYGAKGFGRSRIYI